MKRYDCSGMSCYGQEIDPLGEWVRHSDAEAEVEKWKRAAVWAARNGARDGGPMDEDAPHSLEWDYQGSTTGTCHDGTDASILAALATAAGEE